MHTHTLDTRARTQAFIVYARWKQITKTNISSCARELYLAATFWLLLRSSINILNNVSQNWQQRRDTHTHNNQKLTLFDFWGKTLSFTAVAPSIHGKLAIMMSLSVSIYILFRYYENGHGSSLKVFVVAAAADADVLSAEWPLSQYTHTLMTLAAVFFLHLSILRIFHFTIPKKFVFIPCIHCKSIIFFLSSLWDHLACLRKNCRTKKVI